MLVFEKLEKYLKCMLRLSCPFVYNTIFSKSHERICFKRLAAFVGGFGLGHGYYKVFLQDITWFNKNFFAGLVLSLILGLVNVACVQMQCISLLLLPMYCGKAGRGVLKAIVLTYVVAGPITNMCLNAREVVRVYACSTELSYNLSKAMYSQIYYPLNKALLSFHEEVVLIKDAIGSIRGVISPIEYEIEETKYLRLMKAETYFTDALMDNVPVQQKQIKSKNNTESPQYAVDYAKKMEIRCENQISHAISLCLNAFSSAYASCSKALPFAVMICWPLMLPRVCDIKRLLGNGTCDFVKQLEPDLDINYEYLKMARVNLTSDLDRISLVPTTTQENQLSNLQDAKTSGKRVVEAFEEKYTIVKIVIIAVQICLALLFLRIAVAAVNYHDSYLTSIDFDNVYITGYFKRIDLKRKRRNELTLLPLKKMERNRYIDVHSSSHSPSERSKYLTQILKVTLEAITATTFVMMDRLFYEALDVVRQYALETTPQFEGQDLEVKVEGNGPFSIMMRKLLAELNSCQSNLTVSTELCLPRPRAMPTLYYFKIYGGYLWILMLLYINPYTLRLRRLICSYFYPIREKQRILHLYNSILKKRMKMDKTLRRKAVQAVRAHYLSGENLLSLRMRYPLVLGWLETFAVARMKCLICEETEPRYTDARTKPLDRWHACMSTRCPFVYCNECWQEVGKQCLACDPALAELSDVDSLSDDNPPRY